VSLLSSLSQLRQGPCTIFGFFFPLPFAFGNCAALFHLSDFSPPLRKIARSPLKYPTQAADPFFSCVDVCVLPFFLTPPAHFLFNLTGPLSRVPSAPAASTPSPWFFSLFCTRPTAPSDLDVGPLFPRICAHPPPPPQRHSRFYLLTPPLKVDFFCLHFHPPCFFLGTGRGLTPFPFRSCLLDDLQFLLRQAILAQVP